MGGPLVGHLLHRSFGFQRYAGDIPALPLRSGRPAARRPRGRPLGRDPHPGRRILGRDIERDGDRDFFFFSAERGREYRIETHLGSNGDTVLVLYGPDGGYLVEDDDSGDSGASLLEWVAPSSDTYYIEVSGFDGTPGTYHLSLFEARLAPQPEATEATAQAFAINAIGPGDTVEGRIGDEEDRGYFEFSAQRGREYVIETHLGSISHTVLVLTGPGGLRLEDDDSGDGAAPPEATLSR